MKRYRSLAILLGLGLLLLVSCSRPSTPTPTVEPPTNTPAPTDTPLPPTSTVAVAADTSVPSDTPAPTSTPAPPTRTPTVGADAPAATSTPVPTDTAIPTDTPAPTDTPLPTSTPTLTPQPTATPTQALPEEPDPAVGKALWAQLPCQSCHGANAEGNIGPRLAGTGLSYDQVRARVRLGKGIMPAFSEQQVSDAELRQVYAWLRSLAPPTPTPIARPSFPTGNLTAMWGFVNEMKVRADFAKDLPARQAQDDAGRLGIVHNYAREGIAQADQALDRANKALNEVPNPLVQADLRTVIAQTSAARDRFNDALAQNSYPAAWAQAAEAVKVCRIEALPWATQAIRDAGLVGTVRVRVVDQAGNPIGMAFATALTAREPYGGRSDGSGRVTFVNVAAVPALPVKAYAEGRVYHEVNVNLSPGQTVDVSIALPPLPGAGLAPSASNASITPSSGAGNATVTFGLNATDPQGALDLAEDQIFALNPDLDVAYMLLNVGGSRYQLDVTLPNLGPGLYSWYFFAVDHECNMSGVIRVGYQVP